MGVQKVCKNIGWSINFQKIKRYIFSIKIEIKGKAPAGERYSGIYPRLFRPRRTVWRPRAPTRVHCDVAQPPTHAVQYRNCALSCSCLSISPAYSRLFRLWPSRHTQTSSTLTYLGNEQTIHWLSDCLTLALPFLQLVQCPVFRACENRD